MAEGPIRRACNRCHTQKLSCKRLGNEPCERCVRLKAECKSSPSLRFRKPSNGSNSGNKTSNLRQSCPAQQEQQPQKRTSTSTGCLPVYTMPGIPYPGPYSFDGMTEHLWPGHNIDAGLLIYHSDGNQIYQALYPPQINFMGEKDNLSQGGFLANTEGDTLAMTHSFSSVSPSTTTLSMLSGLPYQWMTPTISHGPSCTEIIGSNDCGWHDGAEAGASTKALFETSLLSGNSNSISNNMFGAPAHIHSSHTAKMNDPRGQNGTQSISVKTVPKSLVSDLCNLSAELWEMSNSVPFANTTIISPPSDKSNIRSSSSSTYDRAFPMDSLFTISRNFIQTVQNACRGVDGEPLLHNGNGFGQTGGEAALGHEPFTRTSGSSPDHTMGNCNDRMDAESFVLLADSTYAALLDVYQRIFHLVDTTATNERPPSPHHNENSLFMGTNKENLKQSLHAVTGPSSWKDTAARACLKICHFPDVSVGGFPVASTAALQLGLGLRLADDFLVHFSHAVADLHSCFPPAMRVDGVTGGVIGEQQQQLPTVTRNDLPHPPLILSDDILSSDGLGASMDWDASTATSVTSSGSTGLFSLQSGMSLSRASSMDDIVVRELDLRQELAGLRNKLAA